MLVDQLQKEAKSMSQCFKMFGVKANSYHKSRQRNTAKRVDTELIIAIKACFHEHKQTYGRRRLQVALREEKGICIGQRRLGKIMKANVLFTVWRDKSFRYAAAESECVPYPNELDRAFNPTQANQSWVSDITYIRTLSGWYYLAAVLDLYSRKIVGFAMGSSASAVLVCQALSMAIAIRSPPANMLIHSDQGCQYTSKLYKSLVAKHGLKGSMSRKGNCWDNAVMERFFRTLKQEQVWQYVYANHQIARQSVSCYILEEYNSKRLHSTLNYLSPNAFEAKMRDTKPL
jgi:transposase InsO family protein